MPKQKEGPMFGEVPPTPKAKRIRDTGECVEEGFMVVRNGIVLVKILTYRSRHIIDGDIRYACADAHDTSGYSFEEGQPAPDAQTLLCGECVAKLDAGAEEMRVDDESGFMELE